MLVELLVEIVINALLVGNVLAVRSVCDENGNLVNALRTIYVQANESIASPERNRSVLLKDVGKRILIHSVDIFLDRVRHCDDDSMGEMRWPCHKKRPRLG